MTSWAPWVVFGLTVAFNAGIAWALVRRLPARLEKLTNSITGLDARLGIIDARQEERHKENLRRFKALEQEGD